MAGGGRELELGEERVVELVRVRRRPDGAQCAACAEKDYATLGRSCEGVVYVPLAPEAVFRGLLGWDVRCASREKQRGDGLGTQARMQLDVERAVGRLVRDGGGGVIYDR